MPLVDVHARLSNTALLFYIIMAIWGALRFFRKKGLNSNYWGALVIAELLILVQGGLGAYLWFSGARPMRTLHVLYGVTSALALPVAFSFTKGRGERPEMLIYTVTFLVTVGLILRAMFTGG